MSEIPEVIYLKKKKITSLPEERAADPRATWGLSHLCCMLCLEFTIPLTLGRSHLGAQSTHWEDGGWPGAWLPGGIPPARAE